MQKKKKQKWTRPQLVVLSRGRTTESVLASCKHPQAGPGPLSLTCTVSAIGRCEAIGIS
jgi:hypothetical protein